MIHIERATRAALLPLRSKHEVINDQLAFPAEEVAKRLLSARSIENILLLHFLPGQFAAFPAQLIAQTGEFLLLFSRVPCAPQPIPPARQLSDVQFVLCD